MTTINPWINFNGNAEEAFTFYKAAFGGEFTKLIRMKDVASTEFPVATEDENKIMLIALPIGNTVLMANDVPSFMGKVSENENRSKIAVNVENREKADALLAALSVGGTVEMAMDNSPWETYLSMFRDKYGIEWVIECAG